MSKTKKTLLISGQRYPAGLTFINLNWHWYQNYRAENSISIKIWWKNLNFADIIPSTCTAHCADLMIMSTTKNCLNFVFSDKNQGDGVLMIAQWLFKINKAILIDA